MNEELQSTNEELSTVNDELKTKVEQLTIANADLRNFFESTDLAVVVLDRELKVRSFTAAATTIFPLQPGDRGRPLADVSSRLAGHDYLHDAQEVCSRRHADPGRITTRDGARTLSLRVLPYPPPERQRRRRHPGAHRHHRRAGPRTPMAAERERLELAVKAGGIGVWEYAPDAGTITVDSTAGAMLGLAADTPHPPPRSDANVLHEDRLGLETALAEAAHGLDEFEARSGSAPPNTPPTTSGATGA